MCVLTPPADNSGNNSSGGGAGRLDCSFFLSSTLALDFSLLQSIRQYASEPFLGWNQIIYGLTAALLQSLLVDLAR
eukprot:scaffold29209_cov223-Skeletonema_menzelii.AAC.1